MDCIYVLITGSTFEDIEVFLNKEDAVQASIQYPRYRIEVFTKPHAEYGLNCGYTSAYRYYNKGELVIRHISKQRRRSDLDGPLLQRQHGEKLL